MKKERTFGIIGGIIAAIIIGVIFVPSYLTNEDNEVEIKIIPPNGTNFEPAPRDWQASGPFQIDRKQYLLGENIFLRVDGLTPNDKGQVAFLRPLNDTHYDVFITIPFDGSKSSFNQYFKPTLSRALGICTTADLIGNWTVVFRGTNYENLKFQVVDKFLPGEKQYYEELAC